MKMVILPKAVYRFNTASQNPNDALHRKKTPLNSHGITKDTA